MSSRGSSCSHVPARASTTVPARRKPVTPASTRHSRFLHCAAFEKSVMTRTKMVRAKKTRREKVVIRQATVPIGTDRHLLIFEAKEAFGRALRSPVADLIRIQVDRFAKYKGMHSATKKADARNTSVSCTRTLTLAFAAWSPTRHHSGGGLPKSGGYQI